MTDDLKMQFKYLEFEKLVRDDNVKLHVKAGGETNFKVVSGTEKINLLKQKLLEEANEVLEAKDNDEIIAEIGDVLDVLQQLIKDLKIKKRLIRKSRRFKAKQRGKFKKGIYVHYVKFPKDICEDWRYKYKDITDKIVKK